MRTNGLSVMALHKVMCVATLLTLLTPESQSQLDACGTAPLNTRIVGGQVAAEGSWPWQVSLQVFFTHICGGTLINNQWVLTAAHCVSSDVTVNPIVILGRQSQHGSNPNEVIRSVSQIIVHPDYNSSTIDNDIALLRLSSSVPFTNYIRPICLAASDSTFFNGTDTWVTGWGNVGFGEPLPSPQDLMEVQIPVVGNRQCNCSYREINPITENMICAGFREGGKGSCQGDSGGPMVSKQNGRWIQAGVVSFAVGCAEPNFPTVFARVSRYQAWINGIITTNQPDFITFTSTGTDTDQSVTCGGPPTPPDPTFPPGPTFPPETTPCGTAPLNTRIVGGQVAPEGSWPWQVSLQTSRHFCGGTLINSQWVLTAAHCFSSPATENPTVILGRQSQQGSNPNEVSRPVSQTIVHPDYNPATSDNDIALLRLSSSVPFTNYIRPICLAASDSTFFNGTDTWVTGWGNVGFGEPLPSPENLMEVEVPVVGNRQCNCSYGEIIPITENMICAGLSEGGKDSCQGDSGGPMVSKQNGRWIQAGVVSFGAGCAEPNFPGVYARVSRYQAWINSIITTNQPGFITFTSTGTDTDQSVTCGGPPAPTGPPTPPETTLCGTAPLNTRIVGGQVAPEGSWPWQVSLQVFFTHICGGTLINNQWVLTAAHCVSSPATENPIVILGRQSQQGSNPNEVIRLVSQTIVHPDYNSSTIDNDIALLRLSSSVPFTNFIRPICLAASDSTFFNGTDTWVTGWGNVGTGVPLPSPQNLMEVQMPVVGNRQCNCNYGEIIPITENMICAGFSEGGKGSCQGDSGGPVMSKQNGRWIQAGVVSFGFGCAEPNFPSVFARVSRYQAWINSIITTNQPGFITFTSTGTDTDQSVTCPGLPAPTTTPTSVPAVPAVVCGQVPLNSRILGGSSVATAGVWPWMASLQMKGTHMCGGTLVAEDAVLSNANCFSSTPSPSDWTVILGRLSQNGSNPFEVTLNVINITVSSLNGSNIAVLHLETKPTLSDYIQPICLDNGQTFSVGTTCWAAGWNAERGGEEQVLQEFQTSVVDCGTTTAEGSICTGAFTLEQGDSGGPLMCKQGSSWFQAAVLSFENNPTSNSNTRQTPVKMMVFTKLSKFQSFLSQTVGTFLSPASTSTTPSGGVLTYSPSLFFSYHLLILFMCLALFS